MTNRHDDFFAHSVLLAAGGLLAVFGAITFDTLPHAEWGFVFGSIASLLGIWGLSMVAVEKWRVVA